MFILFQFLKIIVLKINLLVIMKWLIWGSKGWIGTMVCEILANRGEMVYHAESRCDCENDVLKELQDVKPDRIMSFIGRTHGEDCNTIDYLEKPGKLPINIRDNLYGPMVLALLANKLGIHYTYLGTGCIFEYHDMQNPDLECGFGINDLPNFFGSSYSTVKGFTDRLLHLLPVLNVRIRMPIVNYHHPRNFITKITQYAKVCSFPNSMTVLPELLPTLLDMAFEGKVGTVNLVNHGVITHNEILEMYRKYVDKNFTFENFTIDEQAKILASGRSNNYLSTDLSDTRINDIHTAVKNMLVNWKNENFTIEE